MTASLTVDGYTFDNPPSDYRKIIKLSNNAQPHFQRFTSDFYQSDSQTVEFQVQGELSLNESSDLTELEELQQKAINGGEVSIDFDPFFSGKGVIEDNPFTQEDQRGRYDFSFVVNSISTDSTGYPSHATPTTGNTFELGTFDFGFDPDSVKQSYVRQTESVDTLQGLNRTVDNKGLVPKVTVSGRTDGAGAAALWDKARKNSLSYLTAEFQEGWSLITRLQVGNDPDTPDFVTGLYQYSLDLLVVKDPSGGIGQVSNFIDHGVRDLGTYTADSDAGSSDADYVTFTVDSGSTDLSGQTVTFPVTNVQAQLESTNYVYVADPDNDGNGEVRVNQSAFPSDAAPLVEVETDDSGVTTVTDRRETDTSGGDDTLGSIGFTVDAGSDSDAGVSWSKTVLELDPNASNYVYADGSTGDVSFNTSGFPSGDVELYEVQTDSTSVDVVIDQRAGTTTGGDDTVETLGYDVSGGTGAISDSYVEWTSTTVQLDFGATNYVYVTDDDGDGQGQVKVNQSAVPSDSVPLWEVETDGDGVTSETDLRDTLVGDDPGTGDADLVFSDDFAIDDSDVTFTPFLSFSDVVADPTVTKDYTGIVTLSEAVSDPDDSDLTALGITGFSDTATVDDGGSATGATGTSPSETLTYGSGSDWDNAVSESGVVHESYGDLPGDSVVVIGYPSSLSIGGPAFHLPMHEDSGTSIADVTGSGFDGSWQTTPNLGQTGLWNATAPVFDGSNNEWGKVPNSTALENIFDGGPVTINVWVKSSYGNEQDILAYNGDGETNTPKRVRMLWNGDGTVIWESDADGSSAAVARNSTDLYDGLWHMLTLRIDSNGTLYCDVDGDNKATSSYQTSGNFGTHPFIIGRVTDRAHYTGTMTHVQVFDQFLSASEVSALYDDVTGTSSITTATKSLTNSGKPDLTNVGASLNNESITVDVIGSPGTASEEVKTVTLDGSGDYSLSWNSGHTDFRIRPKPSTQNIEQSPTFDTADLKTEGGSDSDQNPNTTWTLDPGLYDRNGNEYEGGGVVSKYGG